MFRVSFFFNTDLRQTLDVPASCEVAALVIAKEQIGCEWCDSEGMRIEIIRVQ